MDNGYPRFNPTIEFEIVEDASVSNGNRWTFAHGTHSDFAIANNRMT
ncbi:MAG: hypothetical protein ACFFE1_10665 [Candidatus Thorarchaeota archaeon]